MEAIRSIELIWCQKEEFPSLPLPSLSFLLLSAEEGTDNIFRKRNAHSALSADNNIIFCHSMGYRGAGEYIKNLMANTTISEVICTAATVMLICFQCDEAPGPTGDL